MKILLLPFCLPFIVCACSSEDVKPKELKGDWKFVSGRYTNVCIGGESPYVGGGACRNQSGQMSFHMSFTKTEMTRIDDADPTNRVTTPYTVKGKVITGTYQNGHTFTLTINELTDNKLLWHQDDYGNVMNYTMDMEFKR
jgi:hypothetical protein